MTSVLKTTIAPDVSALVDGQSIDASDVTTPIEDLRDYVRGGLLAVTDDDTHVKPLADALEVGTGLSKTVDTPAGDEALIIALDAKLVALLGFLNGSGQLALGTGVTGILAGANGGLGANAAAFSGMLKMVAGVASVAVANTDYVPPSGAVLSSPTIGNLTNMQHDHEDAAGGGKINIAALDTTGVPAGYVATANGSGGAGFQTPGGGGAEPIDVTATGGEALALRDFVFLDSADSEWYKIDTNASPIKCGAIRGVVIEAAGISNGGTGQVRVLGRVSGFTGLSAWGRMYASTTAGAYTQTKPTVTAGGGQVGIVDMGYANSTTEMVVDPLPVQYLKRESLANDASTTIAHHSDPAGRSRKVRAYVASNGADVTLETYASSNRDDREPLRGPSGAGATTTVTSGTATLLNVGNPGGTTYWGAQSFQVTAGRLSQITFRLGTNTGTPTGGITWEIRANSGSDPTGAVLMTGAVVSPTASAVNTVNITDGPFLAAATTYWLLLKPTVAQSSGNSWSIVGDATNTYANGTLSSSSNSGSSWTPMTNDHNCSITTSVATVRDKLAQSLSTASGSTVSKVRLWLRKEGTPTGNLTVKIQTNSGGNPTGTTITNGTSNVIAASTLSTSYGWIEFTFAANPTISGSTTYWVVLETADSASSTNYVEWGNDKSAPAYANGEMKAESASTWSALTADGCFEVLAPGTAYDEPLVVGRASGGTRDTGVRFDDGSGSNPNTNTTFTNKSGGLMDMTCVLEVA